MTRTAVTRTAVTRTAKTPTADVYVLADVENLAGGPDASEREHVRVWRAIREHAVTFDSRTRTIAAASGFAAFRAFSALATVGIPAQRLVRNGKDGAELALLGAVDPDELVRQGVRHVVIASGDHLLAPLASALRARGIQVTLLVGRGTPARVLLEACPRKIRLRLPSASNSSSAVPVRELLPTAPVHVIGRTHRRASLAAGAA